MDFLVAAPGPILISLLGEIAKLKLSKTSLDRQTIFAREQKICTIGYIGAAILLVYCLVAGKNTGYSQLIMFWTAGMHMGALIWIDKA